MPQQRRGREAVCLTLDMPDPGDDAALAAAIADGRLPREGLRAVLVKTPGNGLTNDHTRTLAIRSIAAALGPGTPPMLLASGGTERVAVPHYGLGKRFAKDPASYGKGNKEGVTAAESGANAACPGDLIPMMVFDIPGDTVTAVLLGAFMAQGLTPGPMLFEKHAVLVYGLFAMPLVSNVMLLFVGLLAIRFARGITAIPNTVLHPIVVACAFAGSYAVNSSSFDMLVTAAGGVLGWLMRRTDVPVAPMVIAMLCAPGLENALRQSLLLSDGSLSIFVERPVSDGMLAVLAAVVLVLAVVGLRRRGAARATTA